MGIDVGGTNTKFGLLNLKGNIIDRTCLNTKSFNRNKNYLIKVIAETIRNLISDNRLKKSDISGIGMGWAGFIDPQNGIIKYLPNIPGWRNVALAKILKGKVNIPVYIENDANLITMAEWKMGAGKGCRDLICITIGTGVGGGLILDGALYHGTSFTAGEIGHMPFRDKTIEKYVGNKVLHSKATKLFNNRSIHNRDITDMAKKGNRKAQKYWREIGEEIGFVLAGVVNLLDLEMVIIGGGVSNNFDLFAPAIRKVIKEKGILTVRDSVKIVRAELGDDAGILGAHLLVKEALK